MNVVVATLVKRMSEDGLVEARDGVPLGKRYLVDLDSRRRVRMFNVVRRAFHDKEIVNEVGSNAWLPLELLAVATRLHDLFIPEAP